MGDVGDFLRDPLGEIGDFLTDVWETTVDIITAPISWLGDLITPEIPVMGQQQSSPTYSDTNPVNTIQEGYPIARAYGYNRLAGNYVRVSSSDSSNLGLILCHSQGPVSEVLGYSINNLPYGTLINFNSGYSEFYSGTTDQIYSSLFSGVSSTYRGVAYSAFSLYKDNQVGDRPTINIVGRWHCAKTIGGSGATSWTNNPAQIMYDFYREVEKVGEDEINSTSFLALQEYCQPSTGLSGLTAAFRPFIDQSTVTATSRHSEVFPCDAANKLKPKTGSAIDSTWISASGGNEEQIFAIDFGQPIVMTQLILENYIHLETYANRGIKDFDVRASNDKADFLEHTWGTSDWQVVFDDSGVSFVATQHTAVDQEEPEIFTWANTTPYRFWSLHIKNNNGEGEYMGIRDVEFAGYIPHRYTFDFVFDTKVSVNDAKKMIWRSFNGAVIRSQGQLKAVWESAKNISYNFTEDNIVRGSFKWAQPTKPNIIRITYLDAYDNFKKTYVELKDEYSISQNGEILWEEECLYINNSTVARRRAQAIFNKFQTIDYTCSFTGFPGAQGLEIFDRVTVTHSAPGWNAKDFIIKKLSEDSIGKTSLTCEAYFDGLYSGEDAEPQSSYESNLPNPFNSPDNPLNLELEDASGLGSEWKPRAILTYTQPTTQLSWYGVNVYLSDDDITYYSYGVDYSGGTGYLLDAAIVGVEAGTTLFVKAATIGISGLEGVGVTASIRTAYPSGLALPVGYGEFMKFYLHGGG